MPVLNAYRIPSKCLRSFWLLRPRNEVRARLERHSLIFLALPSAHPSFAFLSVLPRQYIRHSHETYKTFLSFNCKHALDETYDVIIMRGLKSQRYEDISKVTIDGHNTRQKIIACKMI